MNNYALAEPLYKESLIIYEKILGTQTSEYAGLLNDLAYLYENTGNYIAAEPLLKQALDIEEKVSEKFLLVMPLILATLDCCMKICLIIYLQNLY